MADLFSRGVAWLAKKQRRHCSTPAVYERAFPDGEPRRLNVRVVLGRPGVTGEASVESLRIDSNDVDFLVEAGELVMDGEPFDPRTDDRIIVARDGRGFVYEVLPHGDGPVWRWSDPQGTIRRVHARLVDEEPNERE